MPASWPPIDDKAKQRFWKHIDKRGPDECWLWQKSLREGYGAFRTAQRSISAHRLAYVLDNSLNLEDINGWFVLHSCDTPRCCNPKHLRLGTQQDNINM